jgi:hypothetical protein
MVADPERNRESLPALFVSGAVVLLREWACIGIGIVVYLITALVMLHYGWGNSHATDTDVLPFIGKFASVGLLVSFGVLYIASVVDHGAASRPCPVPQHFYEAVRAPVQALLLGSAIVTLHGMLMRRIIEFVQHPEQTVAWTFDFAFMALLGTAMFVGLLFVIIATLRFPASFRRRWDYQLALSKENSMRISIVGIVGWLPFLSLAGIVRFFRDAHPLLFWFSLLPEAILAAYGIAVTALLFRQVERRHGIGPEADPDAFLQSRISDRGSPRHE